jgi:hypothetical protein
MRKKILFLIFAVLALGLVLKTAIAQETSQQPAQEQVISSPVSIDSTAVPEKNLKPGIRHAEVKKLQEILKGLGYLPQELKVTENFGQKTKEALKKLQKDLGLPQTGIFGERTREAIRNLIERKKEEYKEIDLECMKNAVSKREEAVISAYNAYFEAIMTALETRKNDMVSAWTISDLKERNTAINNAWAKYRASVKTALINWQKAKKDAWVQFEKDRVNCKSPETGEGEALEQVEVK